MKKEIVSICSLCVIVIAIIWFLTADRHAERSFDDDEMREFWRLSENEDGRFLFADADSQTDEIVAYVVSSNRFARLMQIAENRTLGGIDVGSAVRAGEASVRHGLGVPPDALSLLEVTVSSVFVGTNELWYAKMSFAKGAREENVARMHEQRSHVTVVYVLADGEAVHPRRTPYTRLLEKMRARERPRASK